jgi:hypothetical protein
MTGNPLTPARARGFSVGNGVAFPGCGRRLLFPDPGDPSSISRPGLQELMCKQSAPSGLIAMKIEAATITGTLTSLAARAVVPLVSKSAEILVALRRLPTLGLDTIGTSRLAPSQ